MKKEKNFTHGSWPAIPVLLCLMGLILLVTPDAASAIVGRLAGVGLLVAGLVQMVKAISDPAERGHRLAWAIPALLAAAWLMGEPLALITFGGRLVGLLIAVKGVQNWREAQKWGLRKGPAIVAAVAGLLLVLLPVTASRLVLRLMGLVALIAGVVMLHDYRQRDLLDGPDGPDIIDAL